MLQIKPLVPISQTHKAIEIYYFVDTHVNVAQQKCGGRTSILTKKIQHSKT